METVTREAVRLPATAQAGTGKDGLTIAYPDEWTGRGKPQIAGGPRAMAPGWQGAQVLFSWNKRTFKLVWTARPPGRVWLTLEWQPVKGAVWRPSDGGPLEKRILQLCDRR